MTRIFLLMFFACSLQGQSIQELQRAVYRAIAPIEHSASAFVAERACVSCHHNILPILMFQMARERGVTFDTAVLRAVEEKSFRSLRGPKALFDARMGATLNDPTPNDSYLLMAAYAAGLTPDRTTSVYARRLVHWQRDGHWVTSDFRPPHSSSYFTATATAVRAIRLYLPGETACTAQARKWLATTKPASTEDAAFRLMGLAWADASRSDLERAARDLLAMRDASGAWPQVRGYAADAYSTGESIFALQEAGVAVPERAYRFLLSTQASDGTWHVHTRMLSPAEVSPPYFTTGFPYGKDEYLSYAGSVWATMALLAGIPKLPGLSKPVIQEDARLIADVPPAPPTYEALVEATVSRDTETALRLIDAGAPFTKDRPLVFASMSGDLVVVKALLAHGAAPSVEALSQAVTFGYPEIVRALIDAGASAKGTEASGINLLHWAAIADRPAVIPLLVNAGVPIDARDKNGFTPLMYAATIDFGDRAVFNALLKAGANPNIRNADGRTATEQARLFLKSAN